MFAGWKQHFKNYFVAGLLVVIPLATTIWLMVEVATWSVAFLTRIPKQFNPVQGLHPVLINLIDLGVGIAAPVLFIVMIGFMARNIVGQWLLNLSEQLLHAIPIAGMVYKTLKQLLTTLFGDPDGTKFRRVVMIEYPRPGIWALAFVTATIQTSLGSENGSPRRMLSAFIPTTPNPTTGWYALIPEEEAIEIYMPVEDVFKMLISAGIVMPDSFMAGLQRRGGTSDPSLNAVELPNLRDLVEQERAGASGSLRTPPTPTNVWDPGRLGLPIQPEAAQPPSEQHHS